MNKKTMANVAAVIDIGENYVEMQVAQLKKNEIVLLEKLEYPIGLGHDVFDQKKIGLDTVYQLSEILTKYADNLQGYPKYLKHKVVSCSAIRQAENRDIVVDQINNLNGFQIQVLNESEEKEYLYFEAKKSLEKAGIVLKGNSFLSYIGAGSIGTAICRNDEIVYTQNIPTGTLKMHEILDVLRRETDLFHKIVERYVSQIFEVCLKDRLKKISNIIISGDDIKLLSRVLKAKTEGAVAIISAQKIEQLYYEIRSMTIEKISDNYAVSENEAAMLYHTVFIYRAIMKACPDIKKIYSPIVDITKAMTRHLLEKNIAQEFKEFKLNGAFSSVKKIISDAKLSDEHVKALYDCASVFFSRTEKIHKLDKGNKHLLKLSALFLSAMPFSGTKNLPQKNCELICSMEVFGVSDKDLSKVALISSYFDCVDEIAENRVFNSLSKEEQIQVLKLTAIFSLAASFNQYQSNILFDMKVQLNEKEKVLLIRANTNSDIYLEKWKFGKCQPFFQHILGIKPELKIQLKMIQ